MFIELPNFERQKSSNPNLLFLEFVVLDPELILNFKWLFDLNFEFDLELIFKFHDQKFKELQGFFFKLFVESIID